MNFYQMNIYRQIMHFLKLRKRNTPHADRPEWLQAEMQDKAAALRADRNKKRLACVAAGGALMYTVKATAKRRGRKGKNL